MQRIYHDLSILELLHSKYLEVLHAVPYASKTSPLASSLSPEGIDPASSTHHSLSSYDVVSRCTCHQNSSNIPYLRVPYVLDTRKSWHRAAGRPLNCNIETLQNEKKGNHLLGSPWQRLHIFHLRKKQGTKLSFCWGLPSMAPPSPPSLL